jgi:hypothetical protein
MVTLSNILTGKDSVTPILSIVLSLLILGGGVIGTPVAAQQVGDQPDIASHADSTKQSNQMTIPESPVTVTCQLDTTFLENYGVVVTDVSSSGTDRISTGFNDGVVDLAIEAGPNSATGTITMTMNTQEVIFPEQPLNHSADCSSPDSPSPPSTSINVVQAVSTQQTNEFSVEETGIQNTSETTVQSTDTTVENGTVVTQSVDLDLLVPDDGDADGDIYNVTIDTSESLANGISVTGADVEADPSGSNELVEVVGSPTVTDEETVTVQVQEAAANQSDGKISREIITVGLTLDSTQHDAGSFVAGETISHVVEDEAGNTTAYLTFESAAANQSDGQVPSEYTNEQGAVDTANLIEAINAWRENNLETDQLLNIINAWRSR